MVGYLTLFLSSFLAATLLPLSSELVLIGLMAQDQYSLLLLWCVATLGNTLGSLINWFLGRYLLHYQDRRWFPVKRNQMPRYQLWFQKYGVWSLLFAWLPAGGDIFTFIAGVMRINPWLFLLLVAIGKGSRYGVVIWGGTLFL